MIPTPRPATRWILATLVFVAVAAAFWSPQPPRALPLDSPREVFSGLRALEYSKRFAIEPRPRGGAAAARGRDFLVRECQALGLEVEIQRDPVNHLQSVSFVENVMARIPGTEPGKVLAMTAHYDSVAWGPGAADCGAGVVVMLEVARALKCGPPLKHDVVFVFTGDEEGGGNGSPIALSHRWMQDLNIVLGLEGRGTYGSAFMFETSKGNLPLMEELAKIDVPKVSNSIMYQVHKRTPNTTDFTHMANRGALGYNVAFVGGLGYYHTANDHHRHLSPHTLQHQGEYMMGLIRYYANDGPKIVRGEEDAVFFNTIGNHLIVYPESKQRLFAIIAAVAFVIALIIGFATRQLRILGVLGSLLLILGVLAATCGITAGLQWASYKIFYVYIMYNAAYYHLAAFFLGTALALGAFSAFRARLTPENLHAAMLLVWAAVLGWLEYNGLTVASYAGTWPLCFGAIGLAAACVARRYGAPRGLTVTLQLLSALPPVFIAVPGMHALYHMGGALTPVPNVAIYLATLFSVGPALLVIFCGGAKRLAYTLAAVSFITFFAGWATQGYTPDKPKMNSLSYALNLDTNQALWLTSDETSDDWIAQFIPNETASTEDCSAILPGHHHPTRHAPAPIAPYPVPALSVVSDATADGKRELVLLYKGANSPEEVRFTVLAPTRVVAASIDGMGELLADSKDNWSVNCGYLPHTGEMTLRLTMDAAAPAPVQVRVQEDRFTLPELTTLGYRPRPDYMIPKPNTIGWWEENRLDSHHAYLTKTYTF